MKQDDDGHLVLDVAEVDQAMSVSDDLKNAIAEAVRPILQEAMARGIPEHVVMTVVATEGLMLAAFMYPGTDESFFVMAVDARDGVSKPEAGDGSAN